MLKITMELQNEGCPRSFVPTVLLRKNEAVGAKLIAGAPKFRFEGIL
jgi:hypothetical protein